MPARFTSEGFVGRDREFGRLAGALATAADGRPTTVLVGASGGVGASRFLAEATRRIARLSEPYTILHGTARGRHADRPYGPVLEAIVPHLSRLADDRFATIVGPAGEELEQLVPGLADRIAAAGLRPSRRLTTDPERRQARLLEAILGVLARSAEYRPVVVVLEDLHRADAATRAFAEFLARIGRPGRLCLVATYQPDELTRDHPLRATLTAMLDRPQPTERIELPPLERDELAALIEGIEGERPSASVLLLVAERSLGVPLVAEELLAARRELSSGTLTGSLEALVAARLALRSHDCRRLLRLLALADAPLTRDEIVATATAFEGEPERRPPRTPKPARTAPGDLDADLAAGLAEAIEHGFLVEIAPELDVEPNAPSRIDFRHELIGHAVARDILPSQRPRHHSALAVSLAARPAAVARHRLAAHEPVEARRAAIRAAAEAEALDAPDDALDDLELALELTTAAGVDEADGDGSLVELKVRAAEDSFAAGQPNRACAFVEVAIDGLTESSDRTRLGLLYDRLGLYRRAAGNHDAAVAAYRRAVELVARTPSVERARVLASLAQVKMLEGTFSESERLAREAIDVARRVGEAARIHEVSALTTLGVDEGWGTEPEAAVARLRDARVLAEQTGRLDEVFRVIANLTTVLDLQGRREEAVEIAREGIEEARRVGLESVYGNFLRGNAADSLFALGRWREARDLSETALEWTPAGVSFVNSAINLAIVEIESSASETAGRLLGRLLLELETVRDSQYSVPVYQAAASFALWRDDLVDARRAVDRGWDRVHETEDWVLVAEMAATALDVFAASAADAHDGRDFAELAAARSRATEVLAEAERAVRSAGVPAVVGSRRQADAHLATARAFAARIDGRDDPAHWAALAERWRALSDRYQTAKALWHQAEAVLAAGEGRVARPAARTPLLAAVDVALELEARPLLRALSDLAARAMIRVPGLEAAPERRQSFGAEAVPVDVPVAALAGAGSSAVTGRGGAHTSGGVSRGTGVMDRAAVANDGHDSSAAVAQSTLLRELVGEPRPRRADTFGLSPREREVLTLLAAGRTNREIGERLFISQKTVGVHVGNILSKLAVSGRVEAAAVAIRLGLTESA